MTAPLELVCPAGTPSALRAAVDAGADVVYCGFRDETNARNFPGLNFDREELRAGIAYAHERGVRVYVAINTFPPPGDDGAWRRAVDDAAALGADAVILADMGVLDYAAKRHPALRRHLSVQASASSAEAIRFYHDAFEIRRAVLPRVLTVAEIAALNRAVPVETEVFAYGGLCVMAEGRCALSGYVTGCSPNRTGACSPASHVRYETTADGLVSRLGEVTVNIFADGEEAGYPTLCKGRYRANGRAGYLFDEPASLNVAAILPDLAGAGVRALKIEGRQRGRDYVARVVKSFRRAVDGLSAGRTPDLRELDGLAEGGRRTAGAYDKAWQ